MTYRNEELFDTVGTETFDIPGGVETILAELHGSAGDGDGHGGFVRAFIDTGSESELEIRVGGRDGTNGGGAHGGGGASDIRISPFGLEDRVLVAGGGGGDPSRGANGGGDGGHPAGIDGGDNDAGGGGGGTQTEGGSGGSGSGSSNPRGDAGEFGIGGDGGDGFEAVGGGGGGGYYGGGGGGGSDVNLGSAGGGGGGSSYADAGLVSDESFDTGVNSDDGYVVLIYVSELVGVSDIQLSDSGIGSLSFAFSPAENADEVRVYRSESEEIDIETAQLIDTIAVGDSEYTDANLLQGEQYSYLFETYRHDDDFGEEVAVSDPITAISGLAGVENLQATSINEGE